MTEGLKKTRVEILLLFALYLFILPRVSMEYDMNFWRQWALDIHKHGLSHTYDTSINYFPVYVYALYVYDLLQGTAANIARNINSIKLLFVFFDFLPLFVLCCFRQRILSFKIPHLWLLLNIAYVFNSMLWGQIDSIYTSLSFLAIIFGFTRPVLGGLLYLFALNTKPQAIEFLPIMALVFFYSVCNARTVLYMLAAMVATELLLLAPFIATGGVGKLVHIAGNVVDLYPRLSICAFNIWYLIQPGNPYFINDKERFVVFSYKMIGLTMFAISCFAVWWPVAKRIYKLRKLGLPLDTYAWQYIFLGTGLICLYFFYFNSQMHERYAHPIIIFFFFHAVASGNYRLYILASIPYILSLDKCFPDYLPIVHYKVMFASKVIAIWYTFVVIYGSYLFWKLVRDDKRLNPGMV